MAPFGLMATIWICMGLCSFAEMGGYFRRGGSLDMWPARVHDVARAVGAAPGTCSFKPISVPPKAVCSVDDQDIAQFLLREGWAELPIDVTDQAYVEASELAHSRGLGIWGDAPP